MFCYFFERRNTIPAVLADTAVFFLGAPFSAKINNQKCCHHVCDFQAQNAFAGGALPPGPTGGAYTGARLPGWFSGGTCGGRGKGREEGKRREGGESSLTSFFTI